MVAVYAGGRPVEDDAVHGDRSNARLMRGVLKSQIARLSIQQRPG